MIIKPKGGMFNGMFRHIGLSSADKVISAEPAGGGDILSETFTGAGYSASGWGTPTVTDAGGFNPDITSGATGAGFTGDYLKVLTDGTWHSAYNDWTYSSTAAIIFVSFYFCITSSGSDDGVIPVMLFYDAASNLIGRIDISKTGGGTPSYDLKGSADNGSDYVSLEDISINTQYLIEFSLNTTADTWEYKVNGVTQHASGATGAALAAFKSLRIGPVDADGRPAVTFYIDKIEIDSAAYID